MNRRLIVGAGGILCSWAASIVLAQSSQTVQFGYDVQGRLSTVTNSDATTRTYVYESSSLPTALTGVIDENAARNSTWGYDSQGRATSSTSAGGADATTLVYNTDGSVTVTDALGAVRTFALGRYGNQSLVSGISGSQCPTCDESAATTYDAAGFVASRTDYNGNLTCYANDPARGLELVRVEGFTSGSTCPSNLASYTPANGTRQRKISTVWDTTFREPDSITEANRTTSFTYDASGNALTKTITDTSVTPNVARTWTYTYDGYGRVLTADGPRTDVTDVTTYTYYTCTTGYQCGQVHTITNAAGQVTTFNTYNAYGQPLTITDPNGILTTLTYDARQRVTSRQFGSETTGFTYYPTGLLKRVTQPDGSYLQYTYDDAHRPTKVQDTLGNSTTYTLDAMGNRIAENTYDPANTLSTARSRVYNTLNQLHQDVPSAGTAEVTTTYGYDNNGNQTSAQAPLARNTNRLYDELNRVKKITDAAAGATQLTYDARDQLTSVTDPMGFITSYQNNGFEQPIQQVSPDSGTTQRVFDSAGNVASSTDARGVVSQFTYDALNRQTQAHIGSGSWPNLVTRSFIYDACANGKGHLCSATSVGSQIQWTYTSQGRVATRSETDYSGTLYTGGGVYPLAYTYNAAGQVASVSYPSGAVVSYTYNGNNQVASISVTVDGATKTLLSNVVYEPFGAVRGWTWGNAATAIRSHNADGNIATISTTGLHLTYQFDNALRVQQIVDQDSAPLSATVGYDGLDRITAATTSATQANWSYDANGNLLARTGTSPATLQYSGGNNRVSSYTAPNSSALISYDPAGNPSSSSIPVLLTYDADGHINFAGQGLNPANALRQPSSVFISYWDRHTLYDDAGHILGVYEWWGPDYFTDQPNQLLPLQETIYLGDLPVGVLMGQMTYDTDGNYTATIHPLYYVHADHLGTPRRLTDPATNAVAWRWDSDAYGAGGPNGNPNHAAASLVYDLRFPGQIYNSLTGLYDNWNRDYDPAMGRYLESDLVGLAGGVNTYIYVNGNPISETDPLGLWGVVANAGGAAEIGSGGGVGGGVAAQANSGVGVFGGGSAGVNVGAYTASGFSPLDNPDQLIVGATAGLGVGGFITNAKCAKELLGPFTTWTLNLPIISLQFASGGGIWTAGASVGKSWGIDFSRYTVTTTTATSASGCGCN